MTQPRAIHIKRLQLGSYLETTEEHQKNIRILAICKKYNCFPVKKKKQVNLKCWAGVCRSRSEKQFLKKEG